MADRGGAAVRLLVALVLLGGLVVGAQWITTTGRPFLDAGPWRELLAGDTVRRSVTGWLTGTELPPPGADAADRRIRPRVPVPPAEPGSYAFMRTAAGAPVMYSPCRRLQVVVNPEGAPAGAMAAVTDAVAQISAATGLSIEVAGTTTEPYRVERKPYQPGRYGERWAPILVAWAGSGRVPEFADAAVGFGGSMAMDPALGDPSYVTGAVVLDRDFSARNPDYLLEMVLHELGHVVGLDHVSDGDQIMWDGGLHGAELGAGDRAGLARLGRGPCTPDL